MSDGGGKDDLLIAEQEEFSAVVLFTLRLLLQHCQRLKAYRSHTLKAFTSGDLPRFEIKKAYA
jgi:hypothetical protein